MKINRKEIMKRAHEIAKTLVGDWYARLALALRQAWKEAKTVVETVKIFAGYHIDGSKANEFRQDAVKLFANLELKKQLQWRMINLNKQTMSFDLDVRPVNGECPKEIMDLAVKYGMGINSYA